jgi:tetratricopeptide (TPR) repeat protein
VRPQEPNAWDSLGLSHHAAGHYAEALDAYDRALALDPRFEVAVAHRANTLWALGRNREAIAQYERYIALAPSSSERQRGYSELFMIHRSLGDRAKAGIAARRLAEAGANPSWADPILALDRGDTKRARDLITLLDERGPSRGARGSTRFWYSLRSELALREGNAQQAIAHARAALRHASPAYVLETYEDLYADVLARTGDLRGAAAEYRRILTVNPSRARTRYKLARVLETIGKREEATEEHRRVLVLWKDADPDAPELRYASRAHRAR